MHVTFISLQAHIKRLRERIALFVSEEKKKFPVNINLRYKMLFICLFTRQRRDDIYQASRKSAACFDKRTCLVVLVAE